MNQDEVADLLRGRRTVNLFEPEPVDEALLMNAIEVARWAPNHRLTEPWKFYVICEKTKEKLARCAADIDAAAKGERAGQARYERMMAVPAGFVLTSARDDDELTDLENYAACCAAAQNLMLYLWSLRVGVKWTTGAVTRNPGFFRVLGIDADAERVVGYFWYGTPRMVPEQKRRSVDAIAVRV